MPPRDPVSRLPTHDVTNQPPEIGDLDLWAGDAALVETVTRHAPAWVGSWAAALGPRLGSEHARQLGFEANRHPPRLVTFDRRGRRIDEVSYHPAYHQLMAMAIEHGVHSIAWRHAGDGGAVAHAAAIYMLTQPE